MIKRFLLFSLTIFVIMLIFIPTGYAGMDNSIHIIVNTVNSNLTCH